MDGAARDYFLERAEAELDLANAAQDARTAQLHYMMASAFLDRAQDGAANDI